MDKEQIKKEIKKRIDKWGLITFYILLFILIVSFFAISDILPINVSLLIILILGLISMISFIVFSGYVYDFIEERYDDFIKREEYWKKPLKDTILDILTIIWFISPFFMILGLSIVLLYPTIGIIFEIILAIFVYLYPFILGKDREG